MATKYQLEIVANGGYSASQVKSMTVKDLKDLLEEFNDDDEIVLHDEGNRYGASFGYFTKDYDECAEDEE